MTASAGTSAGTDPNVDTAAVVPKLSRAPIDPRLLALSRPARRWILLAAVLAAARTLSVVAFGLAIGWIGATTLDSGADTPSIGRILAVLAIPGLAQIAIAWAERRSAHLAAAGIIADLRTQAAAELAAMDVRTRTASATRWRTALTEGLDGIGPYLGSFLPVLASTFIAIPSILVVIGILDLTSAITAAVTLPLIPIFMILIGKLTEGRTSARLRGLAVLSEQMLDLIAGLPTLRAFRRTHTPVAELGRLGESHRSSTMRVLRIAFLSGAVLEFFATLSVALIAVGIGLRLVTGSLDLFAGLTVLVIIGELYVPLRALGAAYHSAREGAEGAAEVLALLDPASRSRARTTEPPDDVAPNAPFEIVFASLAVPSRGGAAPAGLTARARAGTLTALAGPNGSGKSTALLAALGLVRDGVSGTAEVRDRDGRVAAGGALYSQVAWLPQAPAPERTLSSAARASTGQRRLADLDAELARHHPILLLDEPTAHLDDHHARKVVRRLQAAAAGGRTVLVTSHDDRLLAAASDVIEVPYEHH